jgi:hypothetical protein
MIPAKTDLCIEIVVTSGSVKNLRKYQLRGIPEVFKGDSRSLVLGRWQN